MPLLIIEGEEEWEVEEIMDNRLRKNVSCGERLSTPKIKRHGNLPNMSIMHKQLLLKFAASHRNPATEYSPAKSRNKHQKKVGTGTPQSQPQL